MLLSVDDVFNDQFVIDDKCISPLIRDDSFFVYMNLTKFFFARSFADPEHLLIPSYLPPCLLLYYFMSP